MSCGCYNAVKNKTHGGSRVDGGKPARLYRIWRGMKQRCLNPKADRFPDWGGRGITICQQWIDDFAQFRADMGEPPSISHTLDRIDNDGNYEPANCKWSTRSEQQLNRRPNRVNRATAP